MLFSLAYTCIFRPIPRWLCVLGIYFDKALFVPNQSVYNKVGSHSTTQNDPQQVDLSWQLTLKRVWENSVHEDKGMMDNNVWFLVIQVFPPLF